MATAKKRAKKSATKALTWGKGVVHPITKRPCGGRVMSQRDMKLFTKMGKRRAGVTPTKVKEAYGLKKKAAPKRKTASKRKAAPKRKTYKRRTPKRKVAPRGAPIVTGCPPNCQKYVVARYDERYGKYRFVSSHQKLSTAKNKRHDLTQRSSQKYEIIVLNKK